MKLHQLGTLGRTTAAVSLEQTLQSTASFGEFCLQAIPLASLVLRHTVSGRTPSHRRFIDHQASRIGNVHPVGPG